jgi:hypothetical protein
MEQLTELLPMVTSLLEPRTLLLLPLQLKLQPLLLRKDQMAVHQVAVHPSLPKCTKSPIIHIQTLRVLELPVLQERMGLLVPMGNREVSVQRAKPVSWVHPASRAEKVPLVIKVPLEKQVAKVKLAPLVQTVLLV